MKWVRIILELAKVRISILVVVSVATGYLLFKEHWTWSMLLPMIGVFLASCGSSALNQVQDTFYDAKMDRTRNRPIPSGRIDRMWALFVALALLAAGFNLLALVDTHTEEVLLLTAFSVFWYNIVYTYLKRWSAFAVVPGALVGAIPPVIGWTAAGGVVTDTSIMPLAFFLFLWQIPHFWLLLLMFGKDYEQAGLPSVTRLFSNPQLGRITFMWILATAAAGLMLAMVGPVPFPWNLAFLAASIWLVTAAAEILRPDEDSRWQIKAFLKVNLYVLLVMVLMVAQALTTRH